jgi:uncharacterized membrane protein YdjX (TVP38/TMEM64 family)
VFAAAFTPQSLVFLCALLFVDGATIAATSTVLVLTYGRYHPAWVLATVGALASALGGGLQLAVLRWALGSKQPWMLRFAPSRERIDAALKCFPSASFVMLVVARATPVNDAPLKLVAAVVGYPVWLYALASFLGTVPYFYVLAVIGHRFRLPLWLLIGAFALVIVGVAVDWLRRRRRAAGRGTTPSGAG